MAIFAVDHPQRGR